MRSNIIKYIFLSLMTIVIAGCDDDFLDKQPTDALASSTFWATKTDAEMALTGLYSRLQYPVLSQRARRGDGFPGSANVTLMNMEAMSDNGYQTFDYGYRQIIDGTMNETTGKVILYMYQVCYRGIGGCNIFLDNVGRVEGVSEAERNKWIAQAKTLRAYFYYQLATTYGDVPLLLEEPTLENQNPSKSTQEQIFAQIENDLMDAIGDLPEASYSDGHIVKGTANGILARVLLYQGKYADAATAAKAVIDGGSFQLEPVYSHFWHDEEQEGSSEIMFSTKFTMVDPEWQRRGVNTMIHQWGALHITKGYVESFQDINGLDITDPGSVYDPNDPLANRDPRLPQIATVGDANSGIEQKTKSGYGLIKYVHRDNVGSRPAEKSEGTDIVFIRFADVLLMYAEGKIESSQIDQSVLDAINQVRARAWGAADISDIANYPEITTMDQGELRDIVRNERRWELGYEGLRYFDLKRWGIAEQVLNGYLDPHTEQTRTFEAKHYKWPLPIQALDKNPNLVQNPDY